MGKKGNWSIRLCYIWMGYNLIYIYKNIFINKIIKSQNQKNVKQEDNIKAIINCILHCYKSNGFKSNLLNHL